MRFCPNCGLMAADPNLTRCPKCGAALPAPQPPTSPAPPPAAGPRYDAAPREDGLSMADYLLALLVFLIPGVGFVMMLVWSFAPGTRPARRHLAQAYLLRTLLLAVLAALLAMTIGISLITMLQAPFWGGSYAW